MALLLVWALVSSMTSHAATSSSAVGATVLSATTLDITGCDSTSRNLGSLTVGSTSITPGTCAIGFGSSNDTAALRVFQSDGRGTALTQYGQNVSVHRAAPSFYSVATNGASQAWIVGYPGTGSVAPIEYTADGGSSWTSQTCAGATNLTAADQVTGTTIVAVGGGNSVCRTTTGGSSWTRLNGAGPAGTQWYGLDMLPSGEGWSSGQAGRLGKTIDGGQTWSTLPNPDPTIEIYRITAVSSTQLYAAAYKNGASGSPYRDVIAMASSDGGLTWSMTTIQTNVVWGFARTIVALDASHALIGTGSGIYLTSNAGATWTQQSTAGSICLAAYDANTIVSYFTAGQVPVRSTDGGVSWSTLASAPALTGTTYACRAATATTGYVAGHNDQRYASTDAGVTYSSTASAYRNQRGAAAWDAERYLTVGDGGSIRVTTNGGTTFSLPTSGTTQTLWDAEFASASTIVAVGSGGVILRSTDAGTTWSPVTSGTGSLLRAVDRSEGGALYVVGSAGIVLRSLDGGVTWTTRTAPAAVTLNDISTFGTDGLLAAGPAGAVYRSIDAGASWATQPTGSAITINSVDALDGQNAIAVTNGDASSTGTFLRTTNGGATWSSSSLPAGSIGFATRYLDESTYVLVGNAGVRRSTDMGATWTTWGTTEYYALAPIDANTLVVTGMSDSILRLLPGASFNDYSTPGSDFSGATGAFGACLHTASNTAATDWPVAGTGNCTAALATNWRGIAATSAGPTAKVASTATGALASITMKFGAKPASNQPTAAYTAGLTFEVVAPSS